MLPPSDSTSITHITHTVKCRRHIVHTINIYSPVWVYVYGSYKMIIRKRIYSNLPNCPYNIYPCMYGTYNSKFTINPWPILQSICDHITVSLLTYLTEVLQSLQITESDVNESLGGYHWVIRNAWNSTDN